ncbi:MAG TPA: helix-turn-helix domain-containing protein [Micromonosporaceae bacterium]
MDKRALTSPDAGPALGESRARVLDLLRGADAPLGVHDIAERTGLHPNTARFHLDGLVEAGLAERARQERDQPGRPRIVYRATAAQLATGTRNYRLLAEILASLVDGMLPDPVDAATEAGRAWGKYLADQPAPFQRVDADEALRRLLKILDDIGFAPKLLPDGSTTRIALRQCPFRDVADHHRTVVCSMHLGLMQGALAEMRAPVVAERLEPLVEPSLCMSYLREEPDRTA